MCTVSQLAQELYHGIDNMSFKRDRGGFIGNFVVPTSGSARGFFSTTEIASFQRQNLWPAIPVSSVAEYLVIAGGGGSGSNGAGGGGAGGYRSSVRGESSGGGAAAETPAIIYFDVPYYVTIGAGGSPGLSGNDSAFASISSVGGGLGSGSTVPGYDGGSGGGGPTRIGVPGPFTTKAGGAGTAGQGYAGGTATNYDNLMALGGGGGGAGAAGGNTSNANAGNGGAGVSSSITGAAVTRGGGGGGGAQYYPTNQGGCGCGSPGTGGAGGGGDAAPMTAGAVGSNGTANTGGGAGAGSGRAFQSPGSTSGNGGSGVVILRVPNICRANFSAGLSVTETRYGEVIVYSVTQGTGTVTFVPNI